MRVWRRTLLVVAIAGALCACQRQPGAGSGEAGPEGPTDAQREAEMAAQQLEELGGRANAAQRALLEGEFEASGGIDSLAGEGGWDLTLLEDYAQFSRPGLEPDGATTGERDYRERGFRVTAGALTITIKKEDCSAGGAAWPYVASVLYEGVAYQGCARRGVEAGARQTWASVLPDLIPAIDACLARVSARARVTFAAELADGEVSVRLREGNGTRRVCTTTTAGAAASLEHLSDIETLPGEGDPEFQRGEEEPRRQNCRTTQRATGGGGETLGWLIRRGGC